MYWIDSARQFRLPGRRAFLCDTPADIANLPTIVAEGVVQEDDNVSCQKVEVGSAAFVISTSDVYLLNSQSIWKKITKD